MCTEKRGSGSWPRSFLGLDMQTGCTPVPHTPRDMAEGSLGAEGLSFLSLSFPLSPRRPDKYMQGPSWLHLWPGQNDVSSFPGILLQRSLHPGLCLTRMAGERRGMVRPDPADPCRPCCPCLPVGGWPWPRNAL